VVVTIVTITVMLLVTRVLTDDQLEDYREWLDNARRLKDLVAQLCAAIWTWYIPTVGTAVSWIPRPWYPKKATASFRDALASLRRMLWAERITPVSSSPPFPPKILDGLLDVLASAA
jgi:hypothetical protein